MAVILQTSLGDLKINLYCKKRPNATLNFLKLCKVKYYNSLSFYHVDRNFIAQTGDPEETGRGGASIFSKIYGDQARYIDIEKKPIMKHKSMGTVSFVNNGNNMIGSQFFITLGEDLDYLDEVHCIFGQVVEGEEILMKINDAICDNDKRPYQDIIITHTIILEDPYDDPQGLEIPDKSPEYVPKQNRTRIGAFENIDDTEGKTMEEIEESIKDKEAKARATILEMVGDIPDAEVRPPDNVLFVCKLNPVTKSDDLEIIFSQFGKIASCEVIKDQKTGDSLQYAFIEFERPEDCEKAYFKMNNVLIDDRRIHVDFSQSVSKLKYKGLKDSHYRIKQTNQDDLVFEDEKVGKIVDNVLNPGHKRRGTSPGGEKKRSPQRKRSPSSSSSSSASKSPQPRSRPSPPGPSRRGRDSPVRETHRGPRDSRSPRVRNRSPAWRNRRASPRRRSPPERRMKGSRSPRRSPIGRNRTPLERRRVERSPSERVRGRRRGSGSPIEARERRRRDSPSRRSPPNRGSIERRRRVSRSPVSRRSPSVREERRRDVRRSPSERGGRPVGGRNPRRGRMERSRSPVKSRNARRSPSPRGRNRGPSPRGGQRRNSSSSSSERPVKPRRRVSSSAEQSPPRRSSPQRRRPISPDSHRRRSPSPAKKKPVRSSSSEASSSQSPQPKLKKPAPQKPKRKRNDSSSSSEDDSDAKKSSRKKHKKKRKRSSSSASTSSSSEEESPVRKKSKKSKKQKKKKKKHHKKKHSK